MYPSSSSRPESSPQGSQHATAHLTQTMKLLGLSGDDLKKEIEDEIYNNPALEILDDRHCPSCNRPLSKSKICTFCSLPHRGLAEEAPVFVSSSFDFGGSRERQSYEDEIPFDETGTVIVNLHTHVYRQISPDLEPEDRPIARHILSSLDENGLLETPVFEIARYHHIPVQRVEGIIRQIQFADPIGVGSSSPTDALLVQLEALKDTQDVPPLASKAILDGMPFMGRRQYQELGKLLGVSAAEARRIAKFISNNLNPFPGQIHWGSVRSGEDPSPSPYHRPDILISQVNGDPNGMLVVEILMPISGSLVLQGDFKKALKDAPKDNKEQWRGYWDKANLLIKCLKQRNHTMVRLMKILVDRQKEFIVNGNRHYVPMTRASLAEILDVHESTISRAVANKCVQLPGGRIIPLAMFFDRSLRIRTILKDLIEGETKPFSDAELSVLLEKEGIKVARRTVAKYRGMENILAAHLRKKSVPA